MQQGLQLSYFHYNLSFDHIHFAQKDISQCCKKRPTCFDITIYFSFNFQYQIQMITFVSDNKRFETKQP